MGLIFQHNTRLFDISSPADVFNLAIAIGNICTKNGANLRAKFGDVASDLRQDLELNMHNKYCWTLASQIKSMQLMNPPSWLKILFVWHMIRKWVALPFVIATDNNEPTDKSYSTYRERTRYFYSTAVACQWGAEGKSDSRNKYWTIRWWHWVMRWFINRDAVTRCAMLFITLSDTAIFFALPLRHRRAKPPAMH